MIPNVLARAEINLDQVGIQVLWELEWEGEPQRTNPKRKTQLLVAHNRVRTFYEGAEAVTHATDLCITSTIKIRIIAECAVIGKLRCVRYSMYMTSVFAKE